MWRSNLLSKMTLQKATPGTSGWLFCFTLVALAPLPACSKQNAVPPLRNRGQTVYQANCTACHNTNPKIAGSLGPELWGSSQELLRTRVLEGKYPEGYVPKRKTAIMRPMPHLENEIAALHAYLQKRE